MFPDIIVMSEQNNNTSKVFLGGTCNGSKWRDELVKNLEIAYFNPVVEDWTPECQAEEIRQRTECDILLYVITPKMSGVYSIAEVVDDSNKRPDSTILCVLHEDDDTAFDKAQSKSLAMVCKMVEDNGSFVFLDLEDVASYLNSFVKTVQ